MNLYLDIETIPTQNDRIKSYLRSKLRPPGNIKKAESIEAWWAEKSEEAFEEAYRKTSLNGLFGELICICFALDEGPVMSTSRLPQESEREVLEDFFEFLDELTMQGQKPAPVYVGNRVGAFDLRFIAQRAMVHQVEPPTELYHTAADWHPNIFDFSYQLNGRQGLVSLSDIAAAFGLDDPKADVDGSMVWDMVQEGRVDEVVQYCENDVKFAREVYKRLRFDTRQEDLPF